MRARARTHTREPRLHARARECGCPNARTPAAARTTATRMSVAAHIHARMSAASRTPSRAAARTQSTSTTASTQAHWRLRLLLWAGGRQCPDDLGSLSAASALSKFNGQAHSLDSSSEPPASVIVHPCPWWLWPVGSDACSCSCVPVLPADSQQTQQPTTEDFSPHIRDQLCT